MHNGRVCIKFRKFSIFSNAPVTQAFTQRIYVRRTRALPNYAHMQGKYAHACFTDVTVVVWLLYCHVIALHINEYVEICNDMYLPYDIL